jgi:hypothetical protein
VLGAPPAPAGSARMRHFEMGFQRDDTVYHIKR